MLLFTLLIGWTLCGIEMDMFVPSFPELQEVFSLSPFMVELTLAVNFVAHCITCLVIGNLGDRFGYRSVIIYGALIFVIGSILCVFAPNYIILLVGRFLQGAGIAGTTTLSYLVLTNIYSTEKQQEILGWLNGVITIVMSIAPVIGSYIALYFHWRANFSLLLFFGLINFIFSYLYIPNHEARQSSSAPISFKEYKVVFQSKKTLYYILVLTFSVSPYWIFVGISPIFYMEDLGVTLREFGFYQGSLAAVFAVGCFGNKYLIEKFGTKKCTYFGILMSILFIILCPIVIIMKIKSPLVITLLMQLLAVAELAPSNIIYPLMFDVLPGAKGKISAVLMAFRMIMVAFCLQLIGYFYDGTFLVLGLVLFISTALALWFMFKLFITENEITRL